MHCETQLLGPFKAVLLEVAVMFFLVSFDIFVYAHSPNWDANLEI